MVPARTAAGPVRAATSICAGAPLTVMAVIAAAVTFDLGVACYQLFGLHELHAVLEYDDGVWFGSAVRLANGELPYRNFVLDQPPGVPLLLVPFGVLSRVVGTRDAFGAARLLTPVVGAVTVVAAGWLVRHRGSLAVAVASGVAAVYPAALVDERTVMLEPYCAMLCLVGLLAVFDGEQLTDHPRRLVVAGVAFGLAGSCKAFALLPFVVVVGALLIGPGRRRRGAAFVGGAAGAAVVVCGPFLVLAPSRFVHQVVATQLVRSQRSEPAIWDRIFSLIGLLPASGRPHGYPDDSQLADVAVVAAVFALVLAGWGLRAAQRRQPSPPGWTPAPVARSGPVARAARPLISSLDLVAVGIVAVTAFALVEPPAYYGHYAAFLGPFLAVELGLTAGAVGRLRPALVAVAVAGALAAAAVHAVHTVQAQGTGPFQAAGLDALIPAGSCVTGDNPPVLILANRFTSAVPGCPAMVDAYGTTLSAGHGDAPDSSRADRSGAVAAWRQVFAHARWIVLTGGYDRKRIPWTPQLNAAVGRQFERRSTSPTVLLRRSPSGP